MVMSIIYQVRTFRFFALSDKHVTDERKITIYVPLFLLFDDSELLGDDRAAILLNWPKSYLSDSGLDSGFPLERLLDACTHLVHAK